MDGYFIVTKNSITILDPKESSTHIIHSNNRIIKYDNDVYHIPLNDKSYVKFMVINTNNYKVIYYNGCTKQRYDIIGKCSIDRDIEYRKELYIPNDIYKHIVSFIGPSSSNENVSLSMVCIDPFELIKESYMESESSFDPFMILDGLQKRDFDYWNQLVYDIFRRFIKDRPNVVFDILQYRRKQNIL